VVPGFFDLAPYEDRVLAVPVVISIDDEEIHRSHFVARSTDSASRPMERYINGFANIRRVQKYIKSQALSHNIPVVVNYSLDQALSAVIDLVVEKAGESMRAQAKELAAAKPPAPAAQMEEVSR
jgi:2-phosphoglycerate kinase